MTLTTARVDARVQLDSGTVLRLLPAPTPRWPDLLTVHSDSDRTLFSGKVRHQSILSVAFTYEGGSAGAVRPLRKCAEAEGPRDCRALQMLARN